MTVYMDELWGYILAIPTDIRELIEQVEDCGIEVTSSDTSQIIKTTIGKYTEKHYLRLTLASREDWPIFVQNVSKACLEVKGSAEFWGVDFDRERQYHLLVDRHGHVHDDRELVCDYLTAEDFDDGSDIPEGHEGDESWYEEGFPDFRTWMGDDELSRLHLEPSVDDLRFVCTYYRVYTTSSGKCVFPLGWAVRLDDDEGETDDHWPVLYEWNQFRGNCYEWKHAEMSLPDWLKEEYSDDADWYRRYVAAPKLIKDVVKGLVGAEYRDVRLVTEDTPDGLYYTKD